MSENVDVPSSVQGAMRNANRATLVSIATELNQKQPAQISVGPEVSDSDLIACILRDTKWGDNLHKLTGSNREAAIILLEVFSPESNITYLKRLPEDLRSREAMNIAALDMTDIMGLTPPIDITLQSRAFKRAFKRACNAAKSTDNFSEFTWSVLEALNMGPERFRVTPFRITNPPIVSSVQRKAIENGSIKPPLTKAQIKKAMRAIRPPTVTDLITKFLESIGDEPFRREDIHLYLVDKLPHKNPNSLLSTVRSSIPTKWEKERGYIFNRVLTRDGKHKGQFTVICPNKKCEDQEPENTETN